MTTEPRHGMPRWLEFTLAILGGVAALIAIVQFALQFSHPAEPAKAPAGAAAAPATGGLTIVDASLTTARRRNHILGLIPSGSERFLLLDVTIANPQAKSRSNCQLLVDTTAEGGAKSSGVASRASGPDWDAKRAAASFALPAQPALASQFVLPTSGDKLTAARVRVRCTSPEAQLSPWHSVDLSQADWS